MTDKKYLGFRKGNEEMVIMYEWWKKFEGNEKGSRARLRRCKNITEVVFEPYYFKLYCDLIHFRKVNDKRLAMVAGVIAHLGKNVDTTEIDGEEKLITFPAQMARPKEGKDTPRMSEPRFRRLIETSDRDDLYRQLIRAVRLLDRNANIYSLAEGAYWWSDALRKRWASEYYKQILCAQAR